MPFVLAQPGAIESTKVIYGIFILVIVLAYFRYIQKKASSNLPPGPRPLPIVGNVFDLPPQGVPEHEHWIKHKDLYGPISSISVLGHTIIVLHDRDLAEELLEKTSLLTSERPTTEMIFKIREGSPLMPFINYNWMFRYHRKLFHQQIGTNKLVERFRDTQEKETGIFLTRTLEEPDRILEHIRM